MPRTNYGLGRESSPTTEQQATTGASAGAESGAGGGSDVLNRATWLWPSSDFVNFDVGPNSNTGVVALPAIGDTAVILSYSVPNGKYGKIISLGIDFVANGAASGDDFVQGVLPPDLTFSIQIDGRPVKSYEQFNFLPGAVSSPTPISGIMLKQGQTVTILVTNNTLGVSTQFLAARIQGYLFSKNLQVKQQGYQS